MEPLTVMVLKTTDLLEYRRENNQVKNMFHATVATAKRYFHVKVFNINLKEMFTQNNFITISDYSKSYGILEINGRSSVSEAAPEQKIQVPIGIISQANKTPKIKDIQKGRAGRRIYGLFTLQMKTDNLKTTTCEIKDDTGILKMMVPQEKWDNNCKEGDQLQLICLHRRGKREPRHLIFGIHSFIKRKEKKELLKESFEEDGYHTDPKRVVVLKATELFTYDSSENKNMFHATVRTETEFFRVMVFNENLRGMFTPGKAIALSNYVGIYGSLVIHEYSRVSEDQNMESSSSSHERPIEHLKICDLNLQKKEMLVDGEFKVCMKRDRKNFILYGIFDDTGAIKVVVSKHLERPNCETGDAIKLVCFELTSNADEWFLRATSYSYLEVIKHETEPQSQ